MSTPLASYAFAREFGVFDAAPKSWRDAGVAPGADLGALGELRRAARRPLALQVLPAERYQEQLT